MSQVTTNINFRMDKKLKEQLELLCNELGMTMSTAFTIFAKTMVRQQRIPFEVSLSKPNADTIKAIENVEKQENLSQRFSSVKNLMEALNA